MHIVAKISQPNWPRSTKSPLNKYQLVADGIPLIEKIVYKFKVLTKREATKNIFCITEEGIKVVCQYHEKSLLIERLFNLHDKMYD